MIMEIPRMCMPSSDANREELTIYTQVLCESSVETWIYFCTIVIVNYGSKKKKDNSCYGKFFHSK